MVPCETHLIPAPLLVNQNLPPLHPATTAASARRTAARRPRRRPLRLQLDASPRAVVWPCRPVGRPGLPSSVTHRAWPALDQHVGRAQPGEVCPDCRPHPSPTAACPRDRRVGPSCRLAPPPSNLVRLHCPTRRPAPPLLPILIWSNRRGGHTGRHIRTTAAVSFHYNLVGVLVHYELIH
jgi:hypothetical protein